MSYSPGLLVSRWYIITGTIPSSFAFTLEGSGGLRVGDEDLGVAAGIGVVVPVRGGSVGDVVDATGGGPVGLDVQPAASPATPVAALSSSARRVSGWSYTGPPR